MRTESFILLNLALAFYNVGTIWAHEVDIFRSWKLITDPQTFHTVQSVHWKKLPYWIFIPVALSLAGSTVLFWYRPSGILVGEIWIAFIFQFLSYLLTAITWDQWQAKLSKDESGGNSPGLIKL